MKLPFKIKILAISLMSIFSFSILAPIQVADAQRKADLCTGANLSVRSGECKGQGQTIDRVVGRIVNIISVIVGIVAVIMIIIGGFKYITSGGDSNSITSAKHTILYAIVGLIIVALAQVIVRFVLNQVT